jgi:transcriptional regulator GlxA family with amidase domain
MSPTGYQNLHATRPQPSLQDRLLAHVDAQLDNPTLTPRGAALALGVSVRRLHGLLAGTPHSFSRLVVRRRLQRAQALLAQPHASVIDVAFACGFNSVATFYRQYTAAFGASPAGRRQHGAASPEAMKPQGDPCTC